GRTQLYFIDACRIEPLEFAKFATLEPTRVFDEVKAATDDRRAPIYFGAAPGTRARGKRGRPTLFGEAVLRCLDGGAGVESDDNDVRWRVSINSLARALELLAKETGTTQEFVQG